jgi:hypothetical protein
MAEKEKEEKKIIIDEDWKQQARKEKEKLAEVEAKTEEAKETEEQEAKRPLPPADFTGLVSMLATQAFFAMGVLRAEDDEEREPDLNAAKYNIDMLEIIQKKTENNLTEQESDLLQNTLHQVRMTFVKLSQTG